MSESGPWKIDLNRLALTPEVQRVVVAELNKRKSRVFHEEPRQSRFLAGIGTALQVARHHSGEGPNRDAPGFRRIKRHLVGLEKELSKLTPYQRAEFDLTAEHASRAWLRILLKEAAEAAVLEIAEDACAENVHDNGSSVSAEEAVNIAMNQVPSGPQTMLGRTGIPIDAGTKQWRPKWDSDFLIDQFQWECHILTAAANQVITSYASLPPQHNYVGPPRAVIHLISLVGHAWRRAFGREPNDEPNGAFAKVVHTLITQLQIFEKRKYVGTKSLKRALNR